MLYSTATTNMSWWVKERVLFLSWCFSIEQQENGRQTDTQREGEYVHSFMAKSSLHLCHREARGQRRDAKTVTKQCGARSKYTILFYLYFNPDAEKRNHHNIRCRAKFCDRPLLLTRGV